VPQRLSLAEAAEALGVHYQTAYRWVREGALAAVKVGGVYEVDRGALDALLQRRSEPSPPPAVRRVRDWGPLVQRLFRQLVAGDEMPARALVTGLVDEGVKVTTVCQRLIAPALRRIGDEWMEGRLSIAAEHRASAICERLLGGLTLMPAGRPRGVAIVCCPPSETHHLPSSMATAALREDRWRVHHLGMDLPIVEIVAMAERESADLVVISYSWPGVAGEAAATAAAVEAAGIRALVGGPGGSLDALLSEARALGAR